MENQRKLNLTRIFLRNKMIFNQTPIQTFGMTTKKVLVLITIGNEDIETVTIIDVLNRCGIFVTAATISRKDLVTCANGVDIAADISFEDLLDPVHLYVSVGLIFEK